MLLSLLTNLIFAMTILYGSAVKPPGYVQPSKAPDPNPPKYEYGYKISDEKGSGQGKQEQRDGIYALGRYYVQEKDANQDVQYFADDWGYHPVVEYSSVGPHSRSTAKFALGAESVQQLKNKENNLPQLQGIFNGNERLDTLNSVPSNENKAQQTVLQSQGQLLTSQLQQSEPQQPQQRKQEININPFSQVESTREILHTNQQESQPVLLEGEFQHQPLQQSIEGRTSGLQIDHGPQALLADGQSPSLAQNQGENPPGQYNKVTVEEYQSKDQQAIQQFIEQNQKLQQTGQELSQSQFNQTEEHQTQQFLLKHEEPINQLIFPQQQQTGYQQSQQKSNQHANQNVVSEKTDVEKRLLYVQLLPQHGDFGPQSQVQFLTEAAIARKPEPSNYQQNQDEFQRDQYKSEILFENSKQNIEQFIANQNYDSTLLDNYRNKYEPTAKDEIDTSNKLIEHTKNLVTGQDVLNINQAITQDHNINIETTPQSNSEYDTSRIVSENTITNILINHSDTSYSTSVTTPTSEASLNERPIVVADIDENTSQTTANTIELVQEKYESSISTTPASVSKDLDINSPSTVLVTPRPVSNTILAPITAGVQLQSIDLQIEDKKNFGTEEYKVEVQKSLPYYLGKFEYPSSVLNEQQADFNSTVNETNTAELRATENIELGKTLLFFPGQDIPKYEIQQPPHFLYKQLFTEVNNDINVQQLPATEIKENFVELDQQQSQGYKHHVFLQHTGAESSYVTKPPTEITKIIHKPYPVKVPYEVPYPVVKQVQVPIRVQKIIEKPIHVTKYIEKPVPVPQPYPVEKVVERPIHVPIQVTKYIDRPYPVEVRVPYPQPYPVEKVVQRIVKQPYPVQVRVPVPVEKIVEKKVPVPHYVEKPVEKIVEKPVPHYIDRPYPVEVPVPQPYVLHVEVPKTYPIQLNKFLQKPYGAGIVSQTSNIQAYTIPSTVAIPQNLQFGLPLHINAQTGFLNKKSEQQAQQSQQQQTYIYANPYAYAPQINHYLSPKQELNINNGYLPVAQSNNKYFPPKKDCGQQNSDTDIRNFYYTIKPDNYIGLLPPKISSSQLNFVRKLRTARSNFDEKNIRMEYGFMPPLIPSLEIDEQGNPIDKSEK